MRRRQDRQLPTARGLARSRTVVLPNRHAEQKGILRQKKSGVKPMLDPAHTSLSNTVLKRLKPNLQNLPQEASNETIPFIISEPLMQICRNFATICDRNTNTFLEFLV